MLIKLYLRPQTATSLRTTNSALLISSHLARTSSRLFRSDYFLSFPLIPHKIPDRHDPFFLLLRLNLDCIALASTVLVDLTNHPCLVTGTILSAYGGDIGRFIRLD